MAIVLPKLSNDERLDIERCRFPFERLLFRIIICWNVAVISGIALVARAFPQLLVIVAILAALYVTWKFVIAGLFYWRTYGDCLAVSEHQYSEIYYATQAACAYLHIERVPTILIVHGGGAVNAVVAKVFRRRNILIFTSEMIDAGIARGDSRQLMMVIGRQLGHVAAGHLNFSFFLHSLGVLTGPLYFAHARAQVYTADRIGMLIAGDFKSAQRAIISLIVGKHLAAEASLEGIEDQRRLLDESPFAWLANVLAGSPYMVRRVTSLEKFVEYVITDSMTDQSKFDRLAALPPEANTWVLNIGTLIGPASIGDNAMVVVHE